MHFTLFYDVRLKLENTAQVLRAQLSLFDVGTDSCGKGGKWAGCGKRKCSGADLLWFCSHQQDPNHQGQNKGQLLLNDSANMAARVKASQDCPKLLEQAWGGLDLGFAQ